MITSELQTSHTSLLKEYVSKKAGTTLLAFMTGLAGVGVGAAIERQVDHSSVIGISKHEAVMIGQRAAANALAADRLADHYTQEIQQAVTTGKHITDMQFLNGRVSERDNDGYGYQDPIILNLFSEDGKAHYDARGKFLVGAYLGLETTDAAGNLVVDVVPYDAAHDSLIPNDSENLVINPEVYVQGGKNGLALYTYDVQKELTITNPDGSVFSPSLVK